MIIFININVTNQHREQGLATEYLKMYVSQTSKVRNSFNRFLPNAQKKKNPIRPSPAIMT